MTPSQFWWSGPQFLGMMDTEVRFAATCPSQLNEHRWISQGSPGLGAMVGGDVGLIVVDSAGEPVGCTVGAVLGKVVVGWAMG